MCWTARLRAPPAATDAPRGGGGGGGGNDGGVVSYVRPLLGATKAELASYLRCTADRATADAHHPGGDVASDDARGGGEKRVGASADATTVRLWCEDASNASPAYRRNRVRNEVSDDVAQ